MTIIRQGDCLLRTVKSMPADCIEVPHDTDGAIVLMHGEVTTHRHRIEDWAAAGEIAKQAIDRAQRARLLEAPDGTRYLEVREPVTLRHEEHTAHEIPPGLYEVPIQVDMTTEKMPRQVAD